MTRDDLYTFIAGCKLGVLSSLAAPTTTKPSPTVQSALVGIAVNRDLEIIFDTVKSSRKYSNLVSNPSCSFVVGWAGEKTLQCEGVARELAGNDLKRRQETYFQTWPDGPSRLTWPGIVYFAVRPTWIRFSDFDANPPNIVEFSLTGPE